MEMSIHTTYAEGKGEYNTDFHYRVEKGAKLAKDSETGEYLESYIKVGLEHSKPMNAEQYKKLHEEKAPLLGFFTEVGSTFEMPANELIQHITPLTKEEYDKESEGE